MVRRDRNKSEQLSTKAPWGKGKALLFLHTDKEDAWLRKDIQTRDKVSGTHSMGLNSQSAGFSFPSSWNHR